ncbi:MAG: queuosine precursor transporter [Vampirovibrionales bacterium]
MMTAQPSPVPPFHPRPGWLQWWLPAYLDIRLVIFMGMTGLFLTSLLVANLVGSLLFSFTLPFNTPLGQTVLLSGGILLFPLTFLLTDLMNEFFGPQAARFVTVLGLGMALVVYAYFGVAQHLPIDARTVLSKSEFLHFSHLYTDMIVASLTAYVVGQFLDIYLFTRFYQLTQHRRLWLRAQGSTLISQLFDSILVVFIAFWGDLPTRDLWQLALSNYVWKFVIVVAITPLLYAGHAGLRRWMA